MSFSFEFFWIIRPVHCHVLVDVCKASVLDADNVHIVSTRLRQRKACRVDGERIFSNYEADIRMFLHRKSTRAGFADPATMAPREQSCPSVQYAPR
eukprot:5793486-Pleurochrysis_carterae.AAC.4